MMRFAGAAAGVLVLSTCLPPPNPPSSDLPAVITRPTAESRAELARAVSRALNGAVVPLADDALVHESALVVERSRPRSMQGAPDPGRETGRPEHFRLLLNGSQCVLVHEGSGRRFILAATTCGRPER